LGEPGSRAGASGDAAFDSVSASAGEPARSLEDVLDSLSAGVQDPPSESALGVSSTPPPSWTEQTLAELSLEEKAGQLIMPWVLGDFAPEGSESHERIFGMIEDQKVGGVIMSVGTPFEVAAKLNDLQGHAELPLLVAADLETGAGFRMRGAIHMPGSIDLGGATDFPSLMAVGATGREELAYEMGRITAVEARALGIHLPFAPVLDVNNNPDNPIINVRSFGEDPNNVARMGVAFVRGVQENGSIATGKHFPGHGDTETDSHVALPVIRHDRARMDSVELQPFREAIDAGMGAIMTAHISVPSLNGGVREPSTLSPFVLTNVLRGELGFDGIVFTDAMDMSAISRQHTSGEAAVRALEAGADVILERSKGSSRLSERAGYPSTAWIGRFGESWRPRRISVCTRSEWCRSTGSPARSGFPITWVSPSASPRSRSRSCRTSAAFCRSRALDPHESCRSRTGVARTCLRDASSTARCGKRIPGSSRPSSIRIRTAASMTPSSSAPEVRRSWSWGRT
jgi:beta-glucosidase-like glycosyl hydrolase